MSDETAIIALRLASNEVLASRDCNAAGRFFHEDALVLASTGHPISGRTAMTDYFRRLFEDQQDLTILRTTEVVRSDGTTAAEEGHWTMQRPGETAQGRYLSRWDRGETGWQIAAEFFVPVRIL